MKKVYPAAPGKSLIGVKPWKWQPKPFEIKTNLTNISWSKKTELFTIQTLKIILQNCMEKTLDSAYLVAESRSEDKKKKSSWWWSWGIIFVIRLGSGRRIIIGFGIGQASAFWKEKVCVSFTQYWHLMCNCCTALLYSWLWDRRRLYSSGPYNWTKGGGNWLKLGGGKRRIAVWSDEHLNWGGCRTQMYLI